MFKLDFDGVTEQFQDLENETALRVYWAVFVEMQRIIKSLAADPEAELGGLAVESEVAGARIRHFAVIEVADGQLRIMVRQAGDIYLIQFSFVPSGGPKGPRGRVYRRQIDRALAAEVMGLLMNWINRFGGGRVLFVGDVATVLGKRRHLDDGFQSGSLWLGFIGSAQFAGRLRRPVKHNIGIKHFYLTNRYDVSANAGIFRRLFEIPYARSGAGRPQDEMFPDMVDYATKRLFKPSDGPLSTVPDHRHWH